MRLNLPGFGRDADVVVDPRFAWSDPVVARNKVPILAEVDLWAAGEPLSDVADKYGRTVPEAEEICRVGLKRAA
ncbi:hypothetical protein A5647_08000 [Mycobacterium sp. 1100029.7]|nr:hypothetical protein A5647_08000 [Mycobacterium sp. 1100029.7]